MLVDTDEDAAQESARHGDRTQLAPRSIERLVRTADETNMSPPSTSR
ncbi:MAG: hypothetical protein KF901_34185 [Myxococcales bacterium]|nr:hypothetical protein [Myxococcales bacterium]